MKNLETLIGNEDLTAGETYQIHLLTKQAFLNAPHTEHFIVDALRRAGALTISQVAIADDAIIGHVAISPVSISDGLKGGFGLGPISVLPESQGQGVGSKLMQTSLSALKETGAAGYRDALRRL